MSIASMHVPLTRDDCLEVAVRHGSVPPCRLTPIASSPSGCALRPPAPHSREQRRAGQPPAARTMTTLTTEAAGHSRRCELCIDFSYAGRARARLDAALMPFGPLYLVICPQGASIQPAQPASVLLVASHAWAAPAVTETADTIARSEITVAPEAPAATTSGTPNAAPAMSAAFPASAVRFDRLMLQVRHHHGAQINSRPVTRPGEVLEEVPGLIITQHSGEAKPTILPAWLHLDHGTDIAIKRRTACRSTCAPMPMARARRSQLPDPRARRRGRVPQGPYFVRDGDFASGRLGADRLSRHAQPQHRADDAGQLRSQAGLSAASAPLGRG